MGRLASQSDQPDRPSVLPPLSGILRVDKELKLSNENFKQLIEISNNKKKTILSLAQRKLFFPRPSSLIHRASKANLYSKWSYLFVDKDITLLSQLTETPPFPTPHVLAQFANKAYEKYDEGETEDRYKTRLDLPNGWMLLTTASNIRWNNGYFGAAYWHPENQQVVIAHRGTDPTNLGALCADVFGVIFEHHVQQMESANTFANKVVEVLREVSQKKGVIFELFFTGHSLGGWLAQVTTFTTEYLQREKNIFLKKNNDQNCYHPHTVVFESPGCKDMLLRMRDKFDVRLNGRSIDLEHLDITSYLSAPNRINTCKSHLGTVYRIFPDYSDMGWWGKYTALYNLQTHSMQKIVNFFRTEEGQIHKDVPEKLKILVVIDWPICAGFRQSEEYVHFFKQAKDLNDYHQEVKDLPFTIKGYHPVRYQTKPYDKGVNGLSVFCQKERQFLESYRWLRQVPEFFKLKKLFFKIKDDEVQKQAVNILKCYEIENDKIRCREESELQALIPFVKRLLQLFPEIKQNTKLAFSSDGVRNSVYQFETRRYVERISKSQLEFYCDVSSFGEFLKSEEQKVLNLQMVREDEWTGLIKVYQVLQKTGCLSEVQYIVLKLKRLLEVNQFIDLSILIRSTGTPYLLMLACEDKQNLDEETENVIRTLFKTIKQIQNSKIIFITRPGGSTDYFLNDMVRTIFQERFVIREEQLTWSDLTAISREKLLEKSVKFQGAKIYLNQLMSAESPALNFVPLGALLKEEELTIADTELISNGYNEGYYIGRTFRCQKAIKQDISRDISVRNFDVYLAKSEQEYKKLCQLNPERIVHWLERDKTGNFLWQQSQGSLETLRRYIDTESPHTYTADDLVKLLEQEQHQRVMLISDTAGIGKSTILTYLSKQIRRNLPASWVVRIDLNDHTNFLDQLKGKQIDKEKAIGFVSKKVLKLKPGLEVELFKQCCEQKQKPGIVIMLDGFDEISPCYKETVFDLLQNLRQTAVEQLWVTTRPHLREELEDKLQQLSYTLEPFSEENQIEFLTKFWCRKDWFTLGDTIVEEEGRKKLQVYAKELINKLSNSISDKDRQFTGIPLHTGMLAEAFDTEVKIFCQSAESMPQLQFQLDLLGLYKIFIERKYDIFYEDKFRVQDRIVAAKGQRDYCVKGMQEDHRLLALKVLFTEKQVTLFQKNGECSFSEEDLTRIGIVQVSLDGKPYFIHRTFAEYYVAECLVNRLTTGNNISQQELDFILKEVLKKNYYRVVRVFIDGLLPRSRPKEQVLKEYEHPSHGLCKDSQVYDDNNYEHDSYYEIDRFLCREDSLPLLHRAVIEGNINIIEFFLDSAQAAEDTDMVNKVLLEKDEIGFTAWHHAVNSNNTQVLDKLWQCPERNPRAQELRREMLFVKDRRKTNGWQLAVIREKVEVLNKQWEMAIEILTREEAKKFLIATDSNRMTSLHVAATLRKPEVFQAVFNLAKGNLKTEELTELLLARDNKKNTVFHLAAKYNRREIFLKILNLVKEDLPTEEVKKVLLATYNNGCTFFHMATSADEIEIFRGIFNLVKEKLTTEEVKKLLLVTDNWGMTVFHSAANCSIIEIFQGIFNLAKENLTLEDVKKLLLTTDNKVRTVFHLAANSYRIATFHGTDGCAKENQTTEEVKEFLLAADGGYTVIHPSANSKGIEVFQGIFNLAKEELTTEEVKYLLIATDIRERTVFHLAAKNKCIEIFQGIFNLAKGNLTTEEVTKLVLATDNRGMTVFHTGAYFNRIDVLQGIINLAKENLTTEDVKKLLLTTDNEGWTAIHSGTKTDVIHLIFNLAKENLKTEEAKKMLLATDNYGMTIFHSSVSCITGDLEGIFNLAKENLTREEVKQLLLATDNEGWSVFHLAGKFQTIGEFQGIFNWAKENLTKEEVKKLLATDNKVGTVLHRQVQFRGLEAFQGIVNWAKENLTTQEVKNLLLVTDNEGETFFHSASKSHRIEAFPGIFNLAKETLTTEEVKNLFLATDNKGLTVFHTAAHIRKMEVYQGIFNLAKENLTTKEVKQLLLATDKGGRTFFNSAAYSQTIEVFQGIFNLAKKNLTTEDVEKLLLDTDNKGRTVFHAASYSDRIGKFQGIFDWAKENLTTEKVKELLLATDNMGRTVFYSAATSDGTETLQGIFDYAHENLTTEEVKKLLLATDNKGWTIFHSASYSRRIHVFQIIFNLAKVTLIVEEVNKLLLATDKGGRTVFHTATRGNKIEVFQGILNLGKDNQITEEVIKLLLATDNKGRTVYHSAANSNYLGEFHGICKLIEENLTTEEVKKLLIARDNEGRTALHSAANCNKITVCREIFKSAKKNLTTEEVKKLLLVTDNKERTVFHSATNSYFIGNVQVIFDWAKENLTTEEVNKMSLSTDNKGRTVFPLA